MTLRRWMAFADNGDDKYAAFAARVREAEANIEQVTVRKIHEHGDKDWRALAWWLERRWPDRWGQEKAASARLEAERGAMLDAMLKALERRGVADVAEDVLRELAADSKPEARGAETEAPAKH
jgi:hypothetical protein